MIRTASGRDVHAAHESGHATVDAVLGIPFEYVMIGVDRIKGNAARSGHIQTVLHLPANEEQRREKLLRFAVSTAAGMAGEEIHGIPWADVSLHGKGDQELLVQLADGLGYPRQRFLDWSFSEAKRLLLLDGGAAWRTVASALLAKRRLSWGEVVEMVADARRPGAATR